MVSTVPLPLGVTAPDLTPASWPARTFDIPCVVCGAAGGRKDHQHSGRAAHTTVCVEIAYDCTVPEQGMLLQTLGRR